LVWAAPVPIRRSGKELVVHPSDGDVFVWAICLSEHLASVASFRPSLGSAEKSRVDRFQRSSDRRRGFFNCWTRKTDDVNGRGEGLSIPHDDFDVTLAAGEPAAIGSEVRDFGAARAVALTSMSVAGF
jgi:phosphopantetheinyl transferase